MGFRDFTSSQQLAGKIDLEFRALGRSLVRIRGKTNVQRRNGARTSVDGFGHHNDGRRIRYTPTPAWSAELKALSPQTDDTPLRLDRPKSDSETTAQTSDPSTNLPDTSKLHKLEVSKQALLDEQGENREPLNGQAQNGNDGVVIVDGQTRIIHNGETQVINSRQGGAHLHADVFNQHQRQ